MDLKINREMLPVTEVILDEMQEQSVELDYVLPDYDPDIFRMIGCEIQPTIVTSTTGTDRITYELRADIRVLYCGSGSTLLQCVTQQMTFTRNVELPRPSEDPIVTLRPRTTYANCRAVSPRRLEVRGAVSVAVHVTGDRRQEVIQDVFGMHVQLRKVPVNTPHKNAVPSSTSCSTRMWNSVHPSRPFAALSAAASGWDMRSIPFSPGNWWQRARRRCSSSTPGSRRTVQTAWNRCSSPCRTARS